MKKIVMSALMVIVLIITLQLRVKAQPPDGDPDGDPDLIPIDPGSWVLVAAGVGYGIKKWRDSKQKINKYGGNETTGFMEDEAKINP